MNRGIAQRTVFERREDIRMFLAWMAQVVMQGEIEVHAYSLMSTHFHMLVRSPREQLFGAMRLASDSTQPFCRCP
jgi:putative transposase